jgi:hypothetical protein
VARFRSCPCAGGSWVWADIGYGKLAPIGELGQIRDLLRRGRCLPGYGLGDGVFDEWLSGGGGNVAIIAATRDTLIQS